MEDQLKWMWGAIGILAPACTAGFFFLASRINDLSDNIHNSKTFMESLNTLVKDVHEIKRALLGDYEKPGLIRKVHELDEDLRTIKQGMGS